MLNGGALGAAAGSLAAATLAERAAPAGAPIECHGEQGALIPSPPRVQVPPAYADPPLAVMAQAYTVRVHAVARRTYAAAPVRLAEPGANRRELRATTQWLGANDTLSTLGFEAIVQECEANWGGLTADCAAAVQSGTGAFAIVPAKARNEFAFLFQQNCPADQAAEQCLPKMQSNRLFRSLARAKLEPQPTKMNEGVRTRFTARLRDNGSIRGLSGVATNEGVEEDATAPERPRLQTLIPYSRHMCFGLTSEDPDKAKIEPIAGQGAVIDGGKLCMDVNVTGAIKYEPSWWVTPLARENLRLLLDADYDVQGNKQVFHFQPRPIIVEVVPKPGWWDRIDKFLERATGTANLATALAKAIGALFAAIAGWGIWAWWKRSRSKRRK
jgi:hypothetical protein